MITPAERINSDVQTNYIYALAGRPAGAILRLPAAAPVPGPSRHGAGRCCRGRHKLYPGVHPGLPHGALSRPALPAPAALPCRHLRRRRGRRTNGMSLLPAGNGAAGRQQCLSFIPDFPFNHAGYAERADSRGHTQALAPKIIATAARRRFDCLHHRQ